MKIEIDISDNKVSPFSNQAIDELRGQISNLTNKLVDEALRIEASERLKGGSQEITSSVVQMAADLFLIRYNKVKKRNKKVLIEIASHIFTLLTSILFAIAFDDLQNNCLILVIAIISLGLAITFSVISIMNKYE